MNTYIFILGIHEFHDDYWVFQAIAENPNQALDLLIKAENELLQAEGDDFTYDTKTINQILDCVIEIPHNSVPPIGVKIERLFDNHRWSTGDPIPLNQYPKSPY